MKKGKLIVVEGPDGVGKTTLCKKLIAKLNNKMKDSSILLHVPDEYGLMYDGIKEAFELTKDKSKWQPPTDYIQQIISGNTRSIISLFAKPALKEGKIVIVDRYCYTSLVYNIVKEGTMINSISEFFKKNNKEMFIDDIITDYFGLIVPYLSIFMLPKRITDISAKASEIKNEFDTNIDLKQKSLDLYKSLLIHIKQGFYPLNVNFDDLLNKDSLYSFLSIKNCDKNNNYSKTKYVRLPLKFNSSTVNNYDYFKCIDNNINNIINLILKK